MPSGASTRVTRLRISHPLDTVEDNEEDESAHSESSTSQESSDESSLDEDVVQTKRKTAIRADLTPHHRFEKRPQRRTAMRASERWSTLRPGHQKSASISSLLDDVPFAVVIDNRGREQSRERGKRQIKPPRNASPTTVVSTPTKVIKTSNGKGKEKEIQSDDVPTPKRASRATSAQSNGHIRSNGRTRENGRAVTSTSTPKRRAEEIEAPVYTPSKKQRLPATPSKKLLPITPSKSSAPTLIGDVRLTQSKEQIASDRLFIQPTSSDAYFANHAPRKRKGAAYQTSDNTISNTMAPIAAEVISDLSATIASQLQEISPTSLLAADHYEQHYDYWWSMLVHLERPLIFHGVGSKRAQLQSFARHLAQKGFCSIAVILGDAGGRIEDVMKELELCVGKPPTSSQEKKVHSTTLEARAHHAVEAFAADSKRTKRTLPPYFMILIHSFDTATLLQQKSIHTLMILTRCSRILLCVDVCHINSGLISSLHSDSEHDRIPWLWIGMNTFVPMLQEVINERGPGISKVIGLPRVLDLRSAGGGGGDVDMLQVKGTMQGSSSADSTLLSAKSAIAILKSVTEKAQRLFLSLSKKLSQDASASIPYSELSKLARDTFVATTSDSLRNLLVEFTSHGLIRMQGTEGRDQQNQAVSIALSQRDLQHVTSQFVAT